MSAARTIGSVCDTLLAELVVEAILPTQACSVSEVLASWPPISRDGSEEPVLSTAQSTTHAADSAMLLAELDAALMRPLETPTVVVPGSVLDAEQLQALEQQELALQAELAALSWQGTREHDVPVHRTELEPTENEAQPDEAGSTAGRDAGGHQLEVCSATGPSQDVAEMCTAAAKGEALCLDEPELQPSLPLVLPVADTTAQITQEPGSQNSHHTAPVQDGCSDASMQLSVSESILRQLELLQQESRKLQEQSQALQERAAVIHEQALRAGIAVPPLPCAAQNLVQERTLKPNVETAVPSTRRTSRIPQPPKASVSSTATSTPRPTEVHSDRAHDDQPPPKQVEASRFKPVSKLPGHSPPRAAGDDSAEDSGRQQQQAVEHTSASQAKDPARQGNNQAVMAYSPSKLTRPGLTWGIPQRGKPLASAASSAGTPAAGPASGIADSPEPFAGPPTHDYVRAMQSRHASPMFLGREGSGSSTVTGEPQLPLWADSADTSPLGSPQRFSTHLARQRFHSPLRTEPRSEVGYGAGGAEQQPRVASTSRAAAVHPPRKFLPEVRLPQLVHEQPIVTLPQPLPQDNAIDCGQHHQQQQQHLAHASGYGQPGSVMHPSWPSLQPNNLQPDVQQSMLWRSQAPASLPPQPAMSWDMALPAALSSPQVPYMPMQNKAAVMDTHPPAQGPNYHGRAQHAPTYGQPFGQPHAPAHAFPVAAYTSVLPPIHAPAPPGYLPPVQQQYSAIQPATLPWGAPYPHPMPNHMVPVGGPSYPWQAGAPRQLAPGAEPSTAPGIHHGAAADQLPKLSQPQQNQPPGRGGKVGTVPTRSVPKAHVKTRQGAGGF